MENKASPGRPVSRFEYKPKGLGDKTRYGTSGEPETKNEEGIMVKNLSQLKKALVEGVEFEIVLHHRPECIGQIRRVTKVNSTSFYSVVEGEPEHKLSKANNGLGSWCEFGPARLWTFDAEGVCAKYSDFKYTHNGIVIAFKILEGDSHG